MMKMASAASAFAALLASTSMASANCQPWDQAAAVSKGSDDGVTVLDMLSFQTGYHFCAQTPSQYFPGIKPGNRYICDKHGNWKYNGKCSPDEYTPTEGAGGGGAAGGGQGSASSGAGGGAGGGASAGAGKSYTTPTQPSGQDASSGNSAQYDACNRKNKELLNWTMDVFKQDPSSMDAAAVQRQIAEKKSQVQDCSQYRGSAAGGVGSSSGGAAPLSGYSQHVAPKGESAGYKECVRSNTELYNKTLADVYASRALLTAAEVQEAERTVKYALSRVSTDCHKYD
jgi:hypothetical protein